MFCHSFANDQIDRPGYFLAKGIGDRARLESPGDELINTLWQSLQAATRSRTTESQLPVLALSTEAQRREPGVVS